MTPDRIRDELAWTERKIVGIKKVARRRWGDSGQRWPECTRKQLAALKEDAKIYRNILTTEAEA